MYLRTVMNFEYICCQASHVFSMFKIRRLFKNGFSAVSKLVCVNIGMAFVV